MADLEVFLNARDDGVPWLVRAALAHVQVETIHPFLDGNGRVGRLLITLLLCDAGVLREPLPYLSLYLKRNRLRYYELLDLVRREGEWEAWLEFFANGVAEAAQGAVDTAVRLTDLAVTTGLSYPAAAAAIDALVRGGRRPVCRRRRPGTTAPMPSSGCAPHR